MLPRAGRRVGHAAGGTRQDPGLRIGARRPRTRGPRPARSWKGSATAPTSRCKVKVSTRNIAVYRDPAVILIDQLKSIHIEGELEVVDTTIWHAKVQRKDYAVGLNPTGVGVDDPDVNSRRELHLQVRAQLHRLLQQGGRQADLRAVERDRSGEAQAQWSSRSSASSSPTSPARSSSTDRAATCWQPHVKGVVLHTNSHLQRLALRGRVARQITGAAAKFLHSTG